MPNGLYTTSNAPGNDGGNLSLYNAFTEFGEKFLVGSSDTSPYKKWADYVDVDLGWYWATETGLGTPWAGVSGLSAGVHKD